MNHDLESVFRADVHDAANTLPVDLDVDDILRAARTARRGRRLGGGLLAALASAAALFVAVQLIFPTVHAAPAPVAGPAPASAPIAGDRHVSVFAGDPVGVVDIATTTDGQYVVFASAGFTVTIATPEAGKAVWSTDFADFGAIVVNGDARRLMVRPGLGLPILAEWPVVTLPGTDLTVSVNGLAAANGFDLIALLWSDGEGTVRNFQGTVDSHVSVVVGPVGHQMTIGIAEDPVLGVVAWTEASSGDPVSETGSILIAGGDDAVTTDWVAFATGNDIRWTALALIAVVPAGAADFTSESPVGFELVQDIAVIRLPSGKQVISATWTTPGVTPDHGDPLPTFTYVTADGRTVTVAAR